MTLVSEILWKVTTNKDQIFVYAKSFSEANRIAQCRLFPDEKIIRVEEKEEKWHS